MTSIPKQVVKNALKDNSRYLQLIAKATGSTQSAANELRWLREHVHAQIPAQESQKRESALLQLCQRREKHEPLQYILGSQPFGELDIKCRKGVLIPRPETEAYTTHLAKLLNSERLSKLITKDFPLPNKKFYGKDGSPQPYNSPTLNILDICSGSGCISLLLHAHLTKNFPELQIDGWDISSKAIALATENKTHNIRQGLLSSRAKHQVQFHEADFFSPPEQLSRQFESAHIIISNPPYISPSQLAAETTKSVREWEPRLALVPDEKQEVQRSEGKVVFEGVMHDVFYAELLRYHACYKTCCAMIMEVGDRDQALRVVRTALENEEIRDANKIEIWRDFPNQDPPAGEADGAVTEVDVLGLKIPVIGAGKMRAVVLLLQKGALSNSQEEREAA